MYDEPRYYDIAFGWDIKREADFLEKVFRTLGTIEVQSVLDLACGTGRFTIELARRGYASAGLDASRDMLGYARERAGAEGVPVELFLKDMSDFALFRTFDAAICMTGSLPYLTTLDAVLSHLRHVGEHLKPGALYVIDIPVVTELSEKPFPPQEWSLERDRVKVSARWEVSGPYDPLNQLMTERLTFRGEERGWERVWEQERLVRLFWPQELLALVEASGCFRLAGWYSDFDLERKFGTAAPLGHRMIAVLVKAARPAPVAAAGVPRPEERRWDRAAAGDRRGPRYGRGDRRDGRRPPGPQGQGPGGTAAVSSGGERASSGDKRKRRRRPRGRKPSGGTPPGGQGPQGPEQPPSPGTAG